MSEYKFYYPDGKLIKSEGTKDAKEVFIDFYSQWYYYLNGILSRYVEEQIDGLLLKDHLELIDLIRILAWKQGKIDHHQSKINSRFYYIKGWKDVENSKHIEYRKSDINLSDYLNYVSKLWKDSTCLKDPTEDMIAKALDMLNKSGTNQEKAGITSTDNDRDTAPAGIGTVYMITLLYFISRGNIPIYDRFAQMAVYAIQHKRAPGGIAEYTELPDKKSADMPKIAAHVVMEFRNDITKFFGYEKYKENRDIDRALWVYGHLFHAVKDAD